MPEKLEKYTPEYSLLSNAVKRSAPAIANSLPREARESLIEQERVIEESKHHLKNALQKSNEIIRHFFEQI